MFLKDLLTNASYSVKPKEEMFVMKKVQILLNSFHVQ